MLQVAKAPCCNESFGSSPGQRAAQCGVMGNNDPGDDECNWNDLVKCLSEALKCGIDIAQ